MIPGNYDWSDEHAADMQVGSNGIIELKVPISRNSIKENVNIDFWSFEQPSQTMLDIISVRNVNVVRSTSVMSPTIVPNMPSPTPNDQQTSGTTQILSPITSMIVILLIFIVLFVIVGYFVRKRIKITQK